jgi:hypothetical protein
MGEARRSSLVVLAGLRVEQAVRVQNEEPHVRVIDRALSGPLPSGERILIAAECANKLDLCQVPKRRARHSAKFAANDEVQQLPLRIVMGMVIVCARIVRHKGLPFESALSV